MKRVLFLLVLIFSLTALAQNKDQSWSVKYDSWSASDELHFQEFVYYFGKGREAKLCTTTESCLKNKMANPFYFDRNPTDLKTFADCADLPHILRGYFAWMNDLPFSFPTNFSAASPDETKPDIRYSVFGNKITRRRSVKTGDNFNRIALLIADSVSTAAFRIHANRDVEAEGALFNDFFPINITRSTLVPGTVFYDPNGHILVVYDVKGDGKIYMIDAHPDNTLTRQVYEDSKFVVSSPFYGAGFKYWRPISNVSPGKTIGMANRDIRGFSLVQHYGNSGGIDDTNWKKRRYILNDENVSFGEFVRKSLGEGQLSYNPLLEFKESLKSICEDIKDRTNSVEIAIQNNIHKKTHPIRLPENIYGTYGEWESYSTPARDARLKASILGSKNLATQLVKKVNDRDPDVIYTGTDIVQDLISIYQKESANCNISYTNSFGIKVMLNLDQVISRIYLLSFDPYHCIEARWGASGSELDSCPVDDNKKAWYLAEQSLRNVIERNYDQRMDKTLQELPTSGLGTQTQVSLSILKALRSL